MQLVIADAGPVNYLILIGHIEVLPRPFEKSFIPRPSGQFAADQIDAALPLD